MSEFNVVCTDIIKFNGQEIGFAFVSASLDKPECEVIVDCSKRRINPKSFNGWKILDMRDQVLGTLTDGKVSFTTSKPGVTPSIKIVDLKGNVAQLDRMIGYDNSRE